MCISERDGIVHIREIGRRRPLLSLLLALWRWRLALLRLLRLLLTLPGALRLAGEFECTDPADKCDTLAAVLFLNVWMWASSSTT